MDKFDNGLVTGAVFIDLAKAFDTVDHQLLLTKLENIGLDVNAVAWFKSYLSNRSQVTAINQSYSSPRPVPVGVPQGSILGPLLFLVYINDLSNCMKHCKIMQYADDTLIYYSAKSPQDIEIILNEDLKSASTWFNDNLLTLNYTKSKFVLFGSSRRLKVL